MRDEILNFLFTELIKIDGIGSKKAKLYDKLLSKKHTQYFESDHKIFDLLSHIPEKIVARKIVNNIYEIENDALVTIKLEVVSLNPPSRSKQPYTVTCYLGQNFVTIVFYKYYENYIKLKLKVGSSVFVSGKVEIFNGQIQIVHPDYITENIKEIPLFEPIYPLTNGLTNKEIVKNIGFILENISDLPEWLDEKLISQMKWVGWKESFIKIHKPDCIFDVKKSKYIRRLAFDELLSEQLAFAYEKKINSIKNKKVLLGNTSRTLKNKFINEILNFTLTKDQENAINEIEKDTFSDTKMSRLLQGDVGSGKTIVSFIAMYANYLSGYQSALMAPTEILATQHFSNLKDIFKDYNTNMALLTGSTSKKEKDLIYEELKNGDIDIIVGTHALIQDDVTYHNLGLVITDEQHRFGVNQRANLQNKGQKPDTLYMSATPIPRTYALTIYGDMDVSTIKTRPKGRKKIKTVVKTNKEIKDVLEMMYEELKQGHQIYVIAPLIEESENSDLTNVNDLKEKMTLAFGSKYKIDLVHGKMASAAKELIMNEFLQNKVQILISTTVIEVGVDVPNATMMVIFNAERFGLSTLHQLRGRVGRSELQSSCILISDNDTKRLEIMENTNDGFEISEEDFKLRGHGDLFGTKQSGDMTFKIADLKADYKILLQAREDSLEYLLDKETDANKLRLIGTIIHS